MIFLIKSDACSTEKLSKYRGKFLYSLTNHLGRRYIGELIPKTMGLIALPGLYILGRHYKPGTNGLDTLNLNLSEGVIIFGQFLNLLFVSPVNFGREFLFNCRYKVRTCYQKIDSPRVLYFIQNYQLSCS